jgi:[ribosomal protein S5]-alanine N-acetyltransferase
MLAEVIRTDRLLLRPWAFGDVADVLAFADDAEWSRYLPVPQPYSEADARKFIAAQVLLDRQVHASWAIEHERRVLGGVNVRFSAERRIGELGYSIARPWWGRGLATEAARAVVDATFGALPEFARMRAMADARNAASLRVLEKIGMRREGVLRSNRIARDEPIDEVWYGILRHEWRAPS